MSQVKLGDKNIPFIYQGSELLYPNPIKDNLMMWVDFKGLNNTSYEKQYAENFADNSNNNRLHNFGYQEGSGYNNGLHFDGVDDFISFNNLTVDDFRGKEKFTFDFTITFTNSNKRGSVFCLPLSEQNDGSRRLMVKVNEDKELAVGRYNGSWKGKKTIPINKQTVNVILTFENMEGEDFNLNVYVDGMKFELSTDFVNSGEYYGNPYECLTLGWQGTNTLGDYAFLKEIIHSAKIYDRVLTEKEIKHNYQLEKERWGL